MLLRKVFYILFLIMEEAVAQAVAQEESATLTAIARDVRRGESLCDMVRQASHVIGPPDVEWLEAITGGCDARSTLAEALDEIAQERGEAAAAASTGHKADASGRGRRADAAGRGQRADAADAAGRASAASGAPTRAAVREATRVARTDDAAAATNTFRGIDAAGR